MTTRGLERGRRRAVRGLLALHGGGEYVAGDEAAMDALLAAAVDAAGAEGTASRRGSCSCRRRRRASGPIAAASHGERAFAAAASRGRVTVEIGVAGVLSRGDAADPRVVAPLESAHLVHFPGGDPDLIPDVLRDTPAWAAIRRAYDGGAVIGGASAGAMAMAGRCWTPAGPSTGWGCCRATRCCRTTRPGRLRGWRSVVDRGGAPPVSWLGHRRADARHRAAGWPVAGRRARPRPRPGPDGDELAAAGNGEAIAIP